MDNLCSQSILDEVSSANFAIFGSILGVKIAGLVFVLFIELRNRLRRSPAEKPETEKQLDEEEAGDNKQTNLCFFLFCDCLWCHIIFFSYAIHVSMNTYGWQHVLH